MSTRRTRFHLFLLVSMLVGNILTPFRTSASPLSPTSLTAPVAAAPLGTYPKIGTIITDSGLPSGDGTCDILWIPPGASVFHNERTVRDFASHIAYDGYYWRNGDGAQVKFFQNLDFPDQVWVSIAGSTVNYPGFSKPFGANDDINDLFENLTSEHNPDADYNLMVKMALNYAADNKGLINKRLVFTGHSQGANVAQLLMLEMFVNDPAMRSLYPKAFEDKPAAGFSSNFPRWLINHRYKDINFGQKMQWAGNHMGGGIMFGTRPHWLLHKINRFSVLNTQRTTFVNESTDVVPTMASITTFSEWPSIALGLDGLLGSLEGALELKLPALRGSLGERSRARAVALARSHIVFDDQTRDTASAHGQSFLDTRLGLSTPAKVYRGELPNKALLRDYLPPKSVGSSGVLRLKYLGGAGFDCRSAKIYEQRPSNARPPWHAENCIPKRPGMAQVRPPTYQLKSDAPVRKPDGIPDTLWVNPNVAAGQVGREADPMTVLKEAAIVTYWADILGAPDGPNDRNPFGDAKNDDLRKRPLEQRNRGLNAFGISESVFGIVQNREFIINKVYDAQGNLTAIEQINPSLDCGKGPGGKRASGDDGVVAAAYYPNGHPDDYQAPWTTPDAPVSDPNDIDLAFMNRLVSDTTLVPGSPAWSSQVQIGLKQRILTAQNLNLPSALAYYRYLSALDDYQHSTAPDKILNTESLAVLYEQATVQAASFMQQCEDELSSSLRAGVPAPAAVIIAYWTERMTTDPAIVAWNAQPLAQQWDADLAPLRAALQDLHDREQQLGERGLQAQTDQQQLLVERAISNTTGIGVLRGGLDKWTSSTLSFAGVPSTLINPMSVAPEKAPTILIVPTSALEQYQSYDWMRQWLADYTAGGGTLVVLAQAFGRDWEMLPGGEVRGLGFEEDILCREESVDVVGESPYLVGLRRDRPDLQLDGSFTQYPASATVLLNRRSGNKMPAMIEYPFGAGKVVAMSIYSDFAVINGMQSRDDLPFARSFFLQLWLEATGGSVENTTPPNVPITLDVNVQNTTASPLSSVEVSTDVSISGAEVWRYQAHYNTWKDFPDVAQKRTQVTLNPPLAAGASRQVSVPLPSVATPGLHRIGVEGTPGALYRVESPYVYATSLKLSLGRDYDSYWPGEQAVISGTLMPLPALIAPTTVMVSERSGAFNPIYLVVQPNTPLPFKVTVLVNANRLAQPLEVQVRKQSTNGILASRKLPLPIGAPPELRANAPDAILGTTLPFTITNVGVHGTTYSGTFELRDKRGYLLQTLNVSGKLGHTGRGLEPTSQAYTLTLPGNQAAGRYTLSYRLYGPSDRQWSSGLPVNLPGLTVGLATTTNLPIYDPSQTITAATSIVANQPLNAAWLRLEVLKRFVAGGDTTLLAGGVRGSDGVGRDAHIGDYSGLAVSADGSFALIADPYNQTLRYLDLRTNEMNTIAGALQRNNYYWPKYEYGEDFRDGVGAAVIFDRPNVVAISADSTFALIGDENVIRRLDLRTRRVTTIAGDPTLSECYEGCGMGGGYADGVGQQALFREPNSIAISSDASFALIGEKYNHTIRQLDLTTLAVTTLAGSPTQSGSTDGIGTAARFSSYGPKGLSISGDGSFALIADRSNHTIRRLNLQTLAVTTIAGAAGVSGTADGIGAAARFSYPSSLSMDSAGTFALIADNNRVVRRLYLSTGQVTSPIGNRTPPYPCVDTDGTGTAAVFCSIGDLAMSRDGSTALLISERYLLRRVVVNSGVVRTIAGEGYDPNRALNSSDNRFDNIGGVALAPGGTYALMVADDVLWKVDLYSDRRTLLAGQWYRTNSNTACQLTNGLGAAVRFCDPRGIAISPDGSYALIADTDNNVLRRYDMLSGQVTTYAGAAYVSYNCQNVDGVGTAARFCSPQQIRISSDGTFAVLVDTYNNNIRKIDLLTSAVTLIAGGGTTYGGSDGIGAAASFTYPAGVAISGDMTFVLVADQSNNKIRKIVLATRAVTTLILAGPSIQRPQDIVMGSDPQVALVLDDSGYSGGGGYLRRIDLTTNTLTTINNYYSSYDGMIDVSHDGALILFTARDNGSNTGQQGSSLHRMDYAATLRDTWLPLNGANAQTITTPLIDPALASDPRARGELVLRASFYGPQRTEAITKGRQLVAVAESPFLILPDSYTLNVMTKRDIYRTGESVVIEGIVKNVTAQMGVTLAISDNGVALPAVSLPTLAPGQSGVFAANIPLNTVGYHRIRVAAPDGTTASTQVEVFAPALSAGALQGPLTVLADQTAAYSLTLHNESMVPAVASIRLAQQQPITLTIEAMASITPVLTLAVPANAPPVWNIPLSLGGDLNEQHPLALNVRTSGEAQLTLSTVQVGVERSGFVFTTTTTLPTPLPIPDNNPAGITIPLLVTNTVAISDINVIVSATHSYNNDLRMVLVSPHGTRVMLSNRNLNGQHLTNTIFDDQGLAYGSGPYRGRFRPSQPLSALRDESLAGVWQLEVADLSNYTSGIGSIVTWGLEVTPLAVDTNAPIVAGQRVQVIAPLQVHTKGQAVVTIDGFETSVQRPLDVQTNAGAMASTALLIPKSLVGGTYTINVRVGDTIISKPVTIRNWNAKLTLDVPSTGLANGANFMSTVHITETAGIGGTAFLFVRYNGGEITRTLTLQPNGVLHISVPLIANAAGGRVSVALTSRPSDTDDPSYTPIIDSRPLNVYVFPAYVDLDQAQVSSGMTMTGDLVITGPISSASLNLPAVLGGDVLWHASEVTTTLNLNQQDRMINLKQTPTGRWQFAVPLANSLPAGRYVLMLTVNGISQPVQFDVQGPQIVVHRTDILASVGSTTSQTITLGLDVESTTALSVTLRTFYAGVEIPLNVSTPVTLAVGRQPLQINPIIPTWLPGSGQLDVVFTTSSGQPIGGTQLPIQRHAATLVKADLFGANRGAPLDVVSTVVGRGPATLAVKNETGVLRSVPLNLQGYQTITMPVTLAATTAILTVTLTDNDGNQDEWALDVTQLVPDMTPPQVTLDPPSGTYTTSSTAHVRITGNASDSAGLANVLVEGSFADIDPVTGNYSVTLELPPGTHTLRAVAQDRRGNQTTSSPVSVSVGWLAPTLIAPSAAITATEAQAIISITLTLNEPSIYSGTFRIRTTGGTATSGQDYVPLDTTVLLTPYQTEIVVPLTVINDVILENEEEITLTLSEANRVQLGSTTVSVRITDDDSTPQHSIFLPFVLR